MRGRPSHQGMTMPAARCSKTERAPVYPKPRPEWRALRPSSQTAVHSAAAGGRPANSRSMIPRSRPAAEHHGKLGKSRTSDSTFRIPCLAYKNFSFVGCGWKVVQWYTIIGCPAYDPDERQKPHHRRRPGTWRCQCWPRMPYPRSLWGGSLRWGVRSNLAGKRGGCDVAGGENESTMRRFSH